MMMLSARVAVSEPGPLASGKRCIVSRWVGRVSMQVRLEREDDQVAVVATWHEEQDKTSRHSKMVLPVVPFGLRRWTVRMRQHLCAVEEPT